MVFTTRAKDNGKARQGTLIEGDCTVHMTSSNYCPIKWNMLTVLSAPKLNRTAQGGQLYSVSLPPQPVFLGWGWLRLNRMDLTHLGKHDEINRRLIGCWGIEQLMPKPTFQNPFILKTRQGVRPFWARSKRLRRRLSGRFRRRRWVWRRCWASDFGRADGGGQWVGEVNLARIPTRLCKMMTLPASTWFHDQHKHMGQF